MPSLDTQKYPEIKKLYKSGFPMSKIAKHFGVTIDAVTYAMRKNGIQRRNHKEAQALRFKQKPLSFKTRKITKQTDKDIILKGICLYWAEGYKAKKSGGVDFANSDPTMIVVFMRFLRTCYKIDENRLRILLYSYSDQNTDKLIHYWSKLTDIPKSQFTKPYIRTDFRTNGRKMPYGLIHVRYSDKKLLFDILKRIEALKV